ncbi:benzyl alcohol O-benzoyltransferase-like [Aegilops tauschii subsp. strangulata]|uniref:benzyl alcohol O-benzoyltransferase-like n=1 Tax=Aegilops tauschii subsp. strangulata TaxID=200361 RepID=UPI00098B8CAD|nr:benzyl alcohol O-benzoyltransferase-like [Aegilops tauschii subsp. strangulata]
MAGSPALKFTVRRQPVVLVAPAGPTPRELKRLSDIDDQDALRFQLPIIHFFRRHDGRDDDPAAVLRDAIAAALVHYYPLAGRLRQLEGRKLAVDCTSEGVLFVEADADIRLDQFGAALQPPFPCLDELLFDVPGSSDLLDTPIIHFQVTRLACGGFIMASKIQHTVLDGPGMVQFLAAVAELARGAVAPTVRPVWARELLMAMHDDPAPPTIFTHREYDDVRDASGTIMPLESMVRRSFFFGPGELSTIRPHLPPAVRRSATTFDLLTGCLWRCRTVALAPVAHEEMRMICLVSPRGRKQQSGGTPVVPVGYYGNAFACPVAISTAGDLCANPLSYAVELVMKTKREVDMEYMTSVARLMVRRGRPHFTMVHAYVMADVSKFGFRDHDFGWGTPVYGGMAEGGIGHMTGVTSFLIAVKNSKGEDGLVVPVCLPSPVMDKFVEEMRRLMHPAVGAVAVPWQLPVIRSPI